MKIFANIRKIVKLSVFFKKKRGGGRLTKECGFISYKFISYFCTIEIYYEEYRKCKVRFTIIKSKKR